MSKRRARNGGPELHLSGGEGQSVCGSYGTFVDDEELVTCDKCNEWIASLDSFCLGLETAMGGKTVTWNR